MITIKQIGDTLFNMDFKGKVRIWSIFVKDYPANSTSSNHCAEIIMVSGLDGGKMIEKMAIVTKGKNIGKANETTYLTQAMAEAQVKVESHLKNGWKCLNTKGRL